jgi:protocatechuate 3,4-dioxygenase alpha subunit
VLLSGLGRRSRAEAVPAALTRRLARAPWRTARGRAATDADGRFVFKTVKPGRVPGPNGAMQAPHINVSVFARGMLRQLFTRIYFADESANAQDPILALVPEAVRPTLIAERREGGAEGIYGFDIRLQGEGETAFFEA